MKAFDHPSIQGSDIFGYRVFPAKEAQAKGLKAKTQEAAIAEAAALLGVPVSKIGVQYQTAEQGLHLRFGAVAN